MRDSTVPDKAAEPAALPVCTPNRHQRRALASQARRRRSRGPAAVLNPLAGASHGGAGYDDIMTETGFLQFSTEKDQKT